MSKSRLLDKKVADSFQDWSHEENQDIHNKTPRTLKNGDISLPCHVAFVIKKITGFDSEQCIAHIPLTTALRIKCSGIENREAVM